MKSSSTQSQSPTTPSPRGRAAGAYGDEHARSFSEPWVLLGDDPCVNDVESFAHTVAAVKSKAPGDDSSPRPGLLASVLSHYAAKWLPDVAVSSSSSASGRFLPPESPTAKWLKKRLLLESIVAALPPDVPAPSSATAASDGITCDFLLKLLRAGSIVGTDVALLGIFFGGRRCGGGGRGCGGGGAMWDPDLVNLDFSVLTALVP